MLALHARGHLPVLDVVEAVRCPCPPRTALGVWMWAERKLGETREASWIRKLARRGEPLFNVKHAAQVRSRAVPAKLRRRAAARA